VNVAPEVLIVVPTLGRRADYLMEALESIRTQSVNADVILVAPENVPSVSEAASRFGVAVIPDPGSLPQAINAGVASARPHHRFVNWLGDDDLLTPGSLASTVDALTADPRRVLAYGACSYIDEQGQLLWISRAGRMAERILSWGPDLIPQPGMLVRRDAWVRVGGVDATLRFAFDLDLLLKLRREGTFVNVGSVVSSFRWHSESLTVSDRSMSLDESESVKRRYLSPTARRLSWIWEKPVRGATSLAAREVTRRARRFGA
jgi:glycosyltransferase involved in cell wall biosynthesis